ncbi:YhdT family protein [Cytobacillus kochii]|uniref:YhdT family protein n=1 Tax=Cytobacillus kochii TaxID=859143 RepID=UPI002E1C477B|nr:YhdT family protein [Cytobacillus kochii]
MEQKKLDPRYKVANREALIGVGIAMINFFIWYSFAYGLGSKPVEEYQFILGLPSWFFYSCVLGFLMITVIVWLVVKFLFSDVPFEEEEQ